GGEALVVCSDKSMGIGITIWSIHSGDQILHIPTCAASPNGLLCLRNQFLVASLINRHGSLGGGAIFIWPLNKPQSPIRSYTMEAIGPLSCTKDGVYIAGGAPSGNACIWEVASGKLLKTWHAHHKLLKCMVFSADDSLLITGSDDGMICVWSMVSLLDMEESGSSHSLLHYSSEHRFSITGLLTAPGSSSSIFISSSLDGTCKVWDLVSGKLIQTQVYPVAITAIVLHPLEQLLLAGSIDGRIFVNVLNIGLVEDPFLVAEDKPVVLKGHNGSITALTFSRSGLISTSEDRIVCLWDVVTRVIVKKFNHQKGALTNLVVIPQSSVLPVSNNKRASNQYRVSSLDKYPQPANTSNGLITLLPSCSSLKEDQTSIYNQRTNSLEQQIFDLEQRQTPAAMQMKVETSIDNRIWATQMTKHVMEMNKHLQSRLLDLMQCQLLWPRPTDIDSLTAEKKKKKLKIGSPPLQEQEQSES
ncbi:WD40 domain-containing protein, partial [Cephalotus follicularis]